MSVSLEDRIATINMDGKNYTCEVRQYEERGNLVVWVPEKQQAVTLTYNTDASVSDQFVNEDGDTVTYSHQTWRKNGFAKISVPKKTSTQ